MLGLLATALAAPLDTCARTFGSDELLDAASMAEGAFAGQDADGFTSARIEVESRLACVSDPLSALDVVRVHRVMALGAFLDGDQVRMRHAVAGMMAIDPEVRFPDDLAPSGHTLDQVRASLVGAVPAEGPTLVGFPDGWIEVNGAFSPRVAGDVAATLQKLDNQGVVHETRYYWPGSSLDDWAGTGAMITAPGASAAPRGPRSAVAKPEVAAKGGKATKGGVKASLPAGPASETQAQIDRENRTARHVALLAGTGLGLAATGALYALAATAEENALDGTVPAPQAEVYRDQADGLTWAWIGASVLSGGLAATLVITW